jgi:xylulokinase
VLSPRDFLRLRLTEAVSTDASTACSSLLFNPRTRVWSKTILDLLALPMERLPAIMGGTAIGGRITKTAAVDSRLIEGTVVAVGGSRDLSVAAALGVVDPGQAMLDLLGEGRFILNTAKPSRTRPAQGIVGCHLLPNVWTLELPRVGAPEQLSYLLSKVTGRELSQWSRGGKNPVFGLANCAATVAPGADGVRLDPANPEGFLGLDEHHHRAFQARACFDSPGLAIARLLADMDPEIARPTSLRVTGEGARIPWWCQNVADAIGIPVMHHDLPYPAAQGAALIAGVTAGIWPDLNKAAKNCLSTAAIYRPRKEGAKAFAAALARERELLASQSS